MPQENITPTSVKLDPDLKKRLQKLAERRHKSTHGLIKEAISNYLNKEEKEEKLKQLTRSRWRGKSDALLTEDADVQKWLNSWGSKQESEGPA